MSRPLLPRSSWIPQSLHCIPRRLIFAAGLVVACRHAIADGGLRFSDATQLSGIHMTMTCGETPSTEIIEVNGGGLALIDYDNDGDLDLFVANGATMRDPENGPGSRLFENLGALKFRDVTQDTGIDLRRWAMGVAVGDYDGDGWDDLYVTCYGPNVLLRNIGASGKRGFEDRTSIAGVGDDRWGTSCAFGDLDGDGDLDLYVVNYLVFDIADPPSRASRSVYKSVSVMRGPHGLQPQHDVLYENLGDGTFRNVTESAGCLPKQPAFGLNVVIVDFDRDYRQDIFVGNDSMPNFLFRNQGSWKFDDVGLLSGVSANADGSNQATMGIAIADVDGNSRPDLLTTNFSSDSNTLHLNLDGTFFEDQTERFGMGLVTRRYLGWAAGFFDFDLDGDEDLLVANGHVYPEAADHDIDSDYDQPLLLMERRGDRFVRVEPPAGGAAIHKPRRGRSAAFGDLDADGDVDAVVGELNGPVTVLRNDAASGRWLVVSLEDQRRKCGNHRGIGAWIEVEHQGKSQRRWIISGGGFQSSSTTAAHFGFPVSPTNQSPTATDRTANVIVRWPDGTEHRIDDVRLDQHLRIRRGQ